MLERRPILRGVAPSDDGFGSAAYRSSGRASAPCTPCTYDAMPSGLHRADRYPVLSSVPQPFSELFAATGSFDDHAP